MPFRHHSSDEFSFAGYEIADVAQSHGMRLFVRDMGNGVLRALSPLLMPLPKVKLAAEVPGMVQVPHRAPATVRGLTVDCLAWLGVLGAERMLNWQSTVHCRVIDERTVEVVGWVASLSAMV